MKRIHFLPCLLCAALLLISVAGCTCTSTAARSDHLHVTATTYPLYSLTSAIAAGAENVEIRRLDTGSVSCLHDYTLTVSDMRYLEQADILILNGAGLEEFLEPTLEQLSAVLVDCAQSVDLLEGDSHEHHSHIMHEGHDEHHHSHTHDAHYWMDPRNLICAAEAVARSLADADPAHAELYTANAKTVCDALQSAYDRWYGKLSDLTSPYLVTFHNGFHYFAEAFDLEVLFSMEEEDGATASAKDILYASTLVKEYNLPAIFTETNGSGAAANAVFGETGVTVCSLSMLMAGDDAPSELSANEIINLLYIVPMEENINTLSEVLK